MIVPKIETLADISVVEPDVYMVYGPSGGGKTVMASTFPAPLRYIDCDDGIKSVKWAIREGICPWKEEDIQRVVPTDETNQKGVITRGTGYWQTIDAINFWLGDDEIDKWQTLVLDPLTSINLFAVTAGLDVTASLPKTSAAKSDTKETIQKSGVLMIEVRDYKPAKGFMMQLLVQLRSIARKHSKFVVVLCHEYEKTRATGIGQEPTITGIEPSLIGSQRKDIVKDLDEVWHIKNHGSKVEPEFKVQTRGDVYTVAKSRYGCLDLYEPADFQKIFAKVKDYWKDT